MVTIFSMFLICLPAWGGMTMRKEMKIWMSKRRGHWS